MTARLLGATLVLAACGSPVPRTHEFVGSWRIDAESPTVTPATCGLQFPTTLDIALGVGGEQVLATGVDCLTAVTLKVDGGTASAAPSKSGCSELEGRTVVNVEIDIDAFTLELDEPGSGLALNARWRRTSSTGTCSLAVVGHATKQ